MEQNDTIELVHHVLVLLISVFAIGMVSGVLAKKLKLPDVVLFILAGILVGPGFHWVSETSESFTNQFILTIGSVLILFDGGRNISLAGLKKVWITIALLSVPGVLITVAVTGVAIYTLFDIPMVYAVLIASIIASTDPASIIPVFKQVKIQTKVRETVESESAFNDATGSILTFTVLAMILDNKGVSIGSSTWEFLRTALGGIGVGVLIGYAASYLAAHNTFGIFREYTTVKMIMVAIASYQIADHLAVSGFMATFAAGLIWGNSHLFKLHMTEKKLEMDHFSENITVMMRMLIFIFLGSQVDFSVLGDYWWQSIVAAFVLMFIARPLTIFLSALPDRKAKWTLKQLLFMCWVRETGVIPAALSGIVIGMGVEHGEVISSVTFMAILITILVQGSTTAWAARKLGLELQPGTKELEQG